MYVINESSIRVQSSHLLGEYPYFTVTAEKVDVGEEWVTFFANEKPVFRIKSGSVLTIKYLPEDEPEA